MTIYKRWLKVNTAVAEVFHHQHYRTAKGDPEPAEQDDEKEETAGKDRYERVPEEED